MDYSRAVDRILLLCSDAPTRMFDAVEVVHVSPFRVVARTAELKQATTRLERARTVAFTSMHAVRALLEALRECGQDASVLSRRTLAAVGASTAHELQRFSLRAEVVAKGGGAALAQELVLHHCEGPIFWPHAADARPEFAAAVKAAGYELDSVIAYDAMVDHVALRAAAAEHLAQPFAAIAFSSPRAVRAFLSETKQSLLDHTVLGAIGETTADALRNYHLRVQVIPAQPNVESLISEIAAALNVKS